MLLFLLQWTQEFLLDYFLKWKIKLLEFILHGGVKISYQGCQINCPVLGSCESIFYTSSELELVAKQYLLKTFLYKESLTHFSIYIQKILLTLFFKTILLERCFRTEYSASRWPKNELGITVTPTNTQKSTGGLIHVSSFWWPRLWNRKQIQLIRRWLQSWW